MPVTVETPAASQAVTLNEARSHCWVVPIGLPPTHPDDADLVRAIATAQEYAESFTGLAIIDTRFLWTEKAFPSGQSPIEVPKNPVIAVTAINYIDVDGVSQSFTEFTLQRSQFKTEIYPNFGVNWPKSRGHVGDVQIRFAAGFENEEAVPSSIKSAMLLMIKHLYDNRDNVVIGISAIQMPIGADHLLWPYKTVKP